MSAKNTKSFIASFLKPSNDSVILAAIAAGLYPILFYYSNNFKLVNTWQHLLFLMASFIGLPAVLFFIIKKLFSKVRVLKKWQQYVLPFLGVFTFLFLMKICLYAGVQKKMILGIVLIAAILAFLLWKQYKKIIVLQLLLAIMGLITLVPVLSNQLMYDSSWTLQPDAIQQARFVKKPNVYFIQPDGYVNFSEIDKGYYKIDNKVFKKYLDSNNFKTYPNFRSNYASTLTSNSATFMMKHHYYGSGSDITENTNDRRHSEDTSAIALVSCIASSQWFRLTRYFGDHFVIRYDQSGQKLVYPLLVAFSPRLRTKPADHAYWAVLRQQLSPLTTAPTP